MDEGRTTTELETVMSAGGELLLLMIIKKIEGRHRNVVSHPLSSMGL
jgi:hypothetical protein